MNDERMDPRFRAAVRDELEQLLHPAAVHHEHRRPWFAVVVAVVVAVMVIGVSVLALRNAPHPVPASPSPSTSSVTASPSPSPTARTTAFGPIVAAMPAPRADEQFVAASSDDALYTATTSQNFSTDEYWTITRIDLATGATVHASIDLRWLNALVVGPDGLYATTSIIERDAFESADRVDHVLRLDLRTLRPLASVEPKLKAAQDSGLHLIASTGALYVSSLGGSVVRLDPRTLAVEARSADLVSSQQLQDGNFLEDGPVLADGRVWVEDGKKLTALAPSTLRVAREISFAGSSALRGTLFDVGGELTLWGSATFRIPVTGSPVRVTTPATHDVRPDAVVADRIIADSDSNGAEGLELLDPSFTQLATLSGGGVIAASSHLLWVQGLPGHPTELAAIRVEPGSH